MQPQTEASPLPVRVVHSVFLNQRGLRAGWRLLIFAGILTTIYGLIALATRYAGLTAISGTGPDPGLHYLLPLGQGIGEFALFLLILFASWLMSRIERRNVSEYGLPLRKPAMSNFLTGYVLWGFLPLSVLLLVMRALHVFYFGNLGLRGIQILFWGLLWAFAFCMVGLFEEYSTRGYFLYTLADGIGFWPAAIVMAVPFAWGHMGNSGETHIGVLGTFVFAVFAAATVRRTGNLWLAVGAHAGWDWGQTFFYGVSDSGFQAPGHLLNPSVQGPDWLSGGSVGPEGSVLTLILWTMITAWFVLFYRGGPLSPEKMGRPRKGPAQEDPLSRELSLYEVRKLE